MNKIKNKMEKQNTRFKRFIIEIEKIDRTQEKQNPIFNFRIHSIRDVNTKLKDISHNCTNRDLIEILEELKKVID